jgi:hypothetical protein
VGPEGSVGGLGGFALRFTTEAASVVVESIGVLLLG